MPPELQQLMPLGIILSLFIVFMVAKMMFDRWRFAKEAQHKLQGMILHRAGQPDIKLFSIESDNGVECIKIKTKYDADPIIHILGAPGEFPWVYPLGKSAFVQAHLQGIIFDENDSEPLSNTTELPLISARGFGSIMQAISLATQSAMQKSEQEDTPAGQQKKQKSGLKWVYVGMIILALISAVGVALIAKDSGVLTDFISQYNTQWGIK
ncbi:hypothetical protein M0R04_08145 [Candidatus Dojkabacteria bacterium]|jgi:hypothetical protein|nr:hypothetical protein [Candidatus Dojkabacteria bacterium]